MVDFPRDGSITTARIAELLAPTLGLEKSSEVAEAAAAKLGFSTGSLTMAQTTAILDDLARTPGMVGIAARFARTRLFPTQQVRPESTRPPAPAAEVLPASGPLSKQTPPSAPRAAGASVTADDIAALFAGAMGADKAAEVIHGAARRLGLDPQRFDRTQAMALLDHLAVEPGVVGLCARFGKARLILRFAA